MGGEKLRQVLGEHETFARRVLRSLGVRAVDLDDVLQEVRIGVARGLDAFEARTGNEASDPRAWIAGICQRQTLSLKREGQKRAELPTDPDELDEQLVGEDDGERLAHEHERATVLLQLLAEVPVEQRQVLIAYELEGLEMVEVATLQGIPVNTAWNRKRRGLEKLAAAARRKRLRERS